VKDWKCHFITHKQKTMIGEIFIWLLIFCAVGAVGGLIFFGGDNDMRNRDKMTIGALHGAGCVFEVVRIAIPLIIIVLLIRACS
jgi:hypothetical protein